MTDCTDRYIGRFAPSPTGPLHFGSLLAALASFLDARHHQGRWLLRIEDLDPPREQAGAADQIKATLEAYGLHWDGEIRFQSRQHERYQTAIEQLLRETQAYYCDCSRAQINQRTGTLYDGYCRNRQSDVQPPTAVRVAIRQHITTSFQDRIQGEQKWQLSPANDDFVIYRRDGFFAYQLAVVLDDADQGVNNVVRGIDLLDSTAKQIWLQKQLALPRVAYAHIPVLVNGAGQKLSKQTFATALDQHAPSSALFQALSLLGQQPDPQLRHAERDTLLDWAIQHWRIQRIPATASLTDSRLTPH